MDIFVGCWGCGAGTSDDNNPLSPGDDTNNAAATDCLDPPKSCRGDAVCQDFLNACPEADFAKTLSVQGQTLACIFDRCTAVPKDLTDPDCLPPPPPPSSGLTCMDNQAQGECTTNDECVLMFSDDSVVCLNGCCGVDGDLDGFFDESDEDNCPIISNPSQADCDGDGVGDRCDNCPKIPNPGQFFSGVITDHDKDGIGDACESDDDNDGLNDDVDNCSLAANPNQEDGDDDGVGDACDNCIASTNSGQEDGDQDDVGDLCDDCQNVSDPYQEDIDGDGIGDACESDLDGDGIPDAAGDHFCSGGETVICNDNCFVLPNADQGDADNDGVGDLCDNCLQIANSDQLDADSDETGDACDNDIDGDGIDNASDNCPLQSRPDQSDYDQDGIGDVCDNCPFTSNPDQVTADGGCGDACSSFCTPNDHAGHFIGICFCPGFDTDNDLIANENDNCPDTLNSDQSDNDGDGVGDACDNCPDTSNPDQADSDLNGVGDACQLPCNGGPTCPGGEADCDAFGSQFGIPPESIYCDGNGCCQLI